LLPKKKKAHPQKEKWQNPKVGKDSFRKKTKEGITEWESAGEGGQSSIKLMCEKNKMANNGKREGVKRTGETNAKSEKGTGKIHT